MDRVRLEELLNRHVDGSLTEPLRRELEQMLLDSPDARAAFWRFTRLHSLIREDFQSRAGRRVAVDAVPQIILTDDVNQPSGFWPKTIGWLSQTGPFSYMVATVFMCLLLLGFWAYKLPSDRGPSIASNENSRGSTTSGEASPHDHPAPVFVGRVTGIAGAKWSDEPNYIAPLGVRVALGRTYKIKSGLLEITYHSGAKVILEGPCTYKVESVAGGFLERGKLTARIIHQGPAASAAGAKPQAVFIVHTPTAVVTDLGTEFGVEVDENGDTTSYVFEGKIVVKAGIRGFGDSGIREVQLGAGESVMVGRVRETHHNSTKTETVHFTHPTTPPKFVLVFPRLKRNYLDLADIVAGGDGFGDARDRGIDAVNGRVVLSQPRDMSVLSGLHGDTRYHAVNELPFVDGVFIPDGGEGPVQITSAGHASSDFVDTNNRTWNLIWAGQIVTEYTPKRTVSCWLGNANYAGRRHSVLTMASNKGITFDLDAIRRKFPDVRLVRFTAVAGNTEMRSANPQAPRVSADLWVFVDGSLRFNKTDINSADDGFVVDIPLAPSERFLTLATTDAGNGHSFDWTIFGDPRLKIISKINDRTSGIHETQPSHAASGKEGAPIK